jgi:hypothetical protein
LSQRRAIASDDVTRGERATLVNLSDYNDFLDSADFSDDKVNQLPKQTGNRSAAHDKEVA